MKNSNPLPILLHLEAKYFQLFVIFFAFNLLNNMHVQLFPFFFFFSNLGTLFWFSSAPDENSVFLPYPFAAYSSHPTFLLSILLM